MTEKLYYKNSYLREFKAKIIDFFKEDNNYHLLLNQTAFYPEKGGQPADQGQIGEQKVKYVYQKNDKIYHITDQLPKTKSDLDCKIDWARRFDHMQQHSGQHLLSAVFHNQVQAATISFHLSQQTVTIDLDKKLDKKRIEDIEIKVNEIIYQNRKIFCEFPGDEKIKHIQLRKEPQVDKNIRIMVIDGLDTCACGGTHLSKTGEIGILKIVDYKNYKGGMRIYFSAGKRALKNYQFQNNLINQAKEQLDVKAEQINTEIESLKLNLKDKRDKFNELKEQLLEYKAEEMISEAEELDKYNLILGKYNELSLDDLKFLAQKIITHKDNLVVLGQNKNNTARILMAKSKNIQKFKINEMIKSVLDILEGSGGGHQFFAEGGGSHPEKLNAALKEARRLFQNKMRK